MIAHSRCWHDRPERPAQALDERTRERHTAVHALLEYARRLGWALNTVKRYARAVSAGDLQRPPRYRETLVDPFRDHLRRRRIEDPTVAVTRLLEEIRELDYTGSANLLVRYLNQGRADAERTPPSPRRLVSWLMSRPATLPAHRRSHLQELLASCPQLTVMAQRIGEFAGLLTGRRGDDLDAWINAVDADDLPALHGFVHACARTWMPSWPG